MDFLNHLLGLDAERINAYQMAARTVIVFIASLIEVRITGIQFFGRRTDFDQVTALIIGTLLGNAIFVGTAPFFPLLLAAFLIMLMRRLVAWITFKSEKAGEIIKGNPIALIRAGKIQNKNLAKRLITKNDMIEVTRLKGNEEDLSKIDEIYLERSGEISIIKKKDEG